MNNDIRPIGTDQSRICRVCVSPRKCRGKKESREAKGETVEEYNLYTVRDDKSIADEIRFYVFSQVFLNY